MALAFTRHRMDYPPYCEAVANTVRASGMFTTAGTANPTVKTTGPWSVARTGVGTLVVTFTELFVEVLYVDIGIIDATATQKRAVPTATSPGASPNTPATITIETQSVAGTAADLTGPQVTFDVAFRKGRLTK